MTILYESRQEQAWPLPADVYTIWVLINLLAFLFVTLYQFLRLAHGFAADRKKIHARD